MTTRFRSKHRSKVKAGLSGIFAILILMFVTSCAPQGVTSASGSASASAAASAKDGYSDHAASEQNAAETRRVDITFEGGSGKAHVISPVEVTTREGKSYAKLVFSSSKYDYVIAGGQKYENETPGENSTFTVPVESFDEPFDLIGDTLAMSTPHEIEYRIIWKGDSPDQGGDDAEDSDVDADRLTAKEAFGVRGDGPDRVIAGMKPDGKLELSYAQGFDVISYGRYSLIRIYGVGDYLLVPKEAAPPEGLDEDITVIGCPPDRTYLVSTSAMDLVRQIGAMDHVRFSPLPADKWYIGEAKEYLDSGRMVYAGKYRAPDYELLLSDGCDLAVENTMIYHDPEVKEKLEELGIPVIVETSSYESDPLARLEWIKLYGVLFSKEDEAEEYFAGQVSALEALSAKIGKSVAFFSVNANNTVVVRSPGDYITKMIEMAGGRYVPADDKSFESSGMGTVNMQMEDFFAKAKDADIIIYNSTIEGSILSVDDLTRTNPLFLQFRAVREGNVYCLDEGFFQKTTKMTEFITSLSGIIRGSGDGGGIFRKL